MGAPDDYFRGIDFDKTWEEEDWERFFEAQDRFARELKVPRPAFKPSEGLGFREVLRRFGMDPDDGSPRSFPTAGAEEGAATRRFWEEGVEAEALPAFVHARMYAQGIASLLRRRFHDVLEKTYKSRPHLLLQMILRNLEPRAQAIAGQIAAGHGLGYRSDRVKGNIVRCKRALAHADECLGLVTRLPRRFLPPKEYQVLVRDTARLRNNLITWINLLRDRFTRPSRP